jgi:hypothetical protein
MAQLTNVNTIIPRDLKLRLFSALALKDQRFNHWLIQQAENWLKQTETGQSRISDERSQGEPHAD